MKTTIKAWVWQRFNEGGDLETVWREAGARFPHNIVGWNRVQNLHREWKAQSQVNQVGGEPK